MAGVTPLQGSRVDRLGVVVSGACVVHCLLSPVIAAAAATAGVRFAGEGGVHLAFGILALTVGVTSFVPGYRRHRRHFVLAAALAGMGLLWAPTLAGERLAGLPEALVMITGGLLLVRAHLWNRSFCARCAICCDSDGCG